MNPHKVTSLQFIHLALFSLLVSLAGCQSNDNKIHEPLTVSRTQGPMGTGDFDDPQARIAYERMRLRSPYTKKIPEEIRRRELSFARNIPAAGGEYKSNRWIHRGPFNVGGRTRAFAIDITDENVLIAGGVTGGMWRSEDGGQSWVKTTTPDQIHSVSCVVQDVRPGKTNIWYYGTGEYYAIVDPNGFDSRFSGDGIFKSTDGGRSWSQLPSTASGTPHTLYTSGDFDFVWKVVTDPVEMTKDVVLAAVFNGIFRSEDGGQSWAPVLGFDTTASGKSHYVDIAVTSDGVYYAALSHPGPRKGFYRSTDGINWVEITPSGFPPNHQRTVIAINPNNENEVYFLSHTPNRGLHDHNLRVYTYLSGDGSGAGGHWDNRTNNLPTFPCQIFYDFEFGNYSSQSSYDMCLAIKPGNPDVVFLGGTNVYRSVNAFRSADSTSWIGGYQCDSVTPSNYVYPNHHPDQHVFAFLPSNPDVLFTASDGGIHKTLDNMADTVTWIPLNHGYITGQFYTVAGEMGNTDNDIVIGGLQDNGTYFTNNTSATNSWKWLLYGDGGYCAIPEGRDFYYLSWQTGKTFKARVDDNGQVYSLTRIDPDGGGGYLFINPFILDPNDQRIMYLAAGRFIWRNNDLTAIPPVHNEYDEIDTNWERIDESMIGFTIGSISCLGASYSSPTTLYYGTSTGKVYRLDSANTVNPVKSNITAADFPDDAYVSCISVNPMDENELLLSFSNYEVISIFHSTDRGENWYPVSGNLEEFPDGSGAGPSVNWVTFLPMQDSIRYFAGTSTGLYSTTKLQGDSTIWLWEGSSTIGNVVVNMIFVRPYDRLVAVATHGNGVYSARFGYSSNVRPLAQTHNCAFSISPVPASGLIRLSLNEKLTKTSFLSLYSITGNRIIQIPVMPSSTGQEVEIPLNALKNLPAFPGLIIAAWEVDGKSICTKKFIYTNN